MKVVIAGGGTGGHLFPGIAVAEEFRATGGADSVVFVGTDHGIEARIVPREGYAFHHVRAEGIVGKSFVRKARAILLFLLSLSDARRILKSLEPDIVIGVGGYASVGTVLAAHALGIPCMIIEQNAVPGLANRFLGRWADAVAVTYQESISFFPDEKTFLTGNPVRRGLLRRDSEAAYALFPLDREKFTVLIIGGSSGAQRINECMAEALQYLVDLRQNIQFLHQTGERDHKVVTESYRRLSFQGIVVPFIYQMAEAYTLADLVVSRSGATALAEITAVGKASILVPYPFAAAHHQEFNARKLQDMGAARLILQKDLDGKVLAREIRGIYQDRGLREEMQRAARACGRVDAAERIVKIAVSLAKTRNRT